MNIDKLILLEYQNLLNESTTEELEKKRRELQQELDSTPNPEHDLAITKKRAILKDKIEEIRKKIENSSSGENDSEDDEGNPEENIKMIDKNIQTERENIEKSMTRIQELNKKKKTSTDPSVEDKEIAKEKSKIDQSNEDLRELKAEKDKEKKKIDSNSSKNSDTTKTDTDKPDTENTNDKSDSGNKDNKKTNDEIDKLSEEIKTLREKISKTIDAKNDAISEIKKRTDELASNELLQSFVRKERLKGVIEYNEKVLSMMTSDNQKKAIDERLKKLKTEEDEISKTLDKATKKSDGKNKNDEEYQKARKRSEEMERNIEGGEGETSGQENSNMSRSDEPETSNVSISEDPKEIKKKEIRIKLDNLEKKLQLVKDSKKDAEEKGNKEEVESIDVNIKSLEDAINQLKKEKETLGESFDEIDAKIWALEWIVEDLLYRIDNQLFLIND
jgi:chromosome segregation ATPase